MGKGYENLARKEIPESKPEDELGFENIRSVLKKEPDFENGTYQEEARDCLEEVLTVKEWAFILDVSPEFVRMMIRREKAIPQRLISSIAKGMRIHERKMRELNDWAYDMLESSYGPKPKEGM